MTFIFFLSYIIFCLPFVTEENKKDKDWRGRVTFQFNICYLIRENIRFVTEEVSLMTNKISLMAGKISLVA